MQEELNFQNFTSFLQFFVCIFICTPSQAEQ